MKWTVVVYCGWCLMTFQSLWCPPELSKQPKRTRLDRYATAKMTCRPSRGAFLPHSARFSLHSDNSTFAAKRWDWCSLQWCSGHSAERLSYNDLCYSRAEISNSAYLNVESPLIAACSVHLMFLFIDRVALSSMFRQQRYMQSSHEPAGK